MSDAAAVYLEILRRQTPAQKLAAIHSLRRTAWSLKAAWIRASEPDLSESDVQAQVRMIFRRAVD